MRFAHLFTVVLSSALISRAAAALAANVTQELAPQIVDVSKQSGCGSTGPLGDGHYKWYIVVSCQSGQQLRCQATDASGCEPGKTNKIGSLEVDDPDDTFQVAKGNHVNSLSFVCPSGGQIRCQANFEDTNDGPNYSLRVVS